MNFFKDCTTLDEARKLYYKLAKVYHPDCGGKKEDFQTLQNEFEKFKPSKEKYEGEFKSWQARPYMDIVEQLMKIRGIIITICGSWIWISGNTKPVKDQIKDIKTEDTGYKSGFSKNKKQWYFSPVGYRKFSKKSLSFAEIKNLYGAEELEGEKQREIA
jgi:hypothetical protein